jgi:hypothetical protein
MPCLQKIAKLKESLHFIGAPAKNKHTVFVDSTQEAAGFEPEKYLDTPKVHTYRGQGREGVGAVGDVGEVAAGVGVAMETAVLMRLQMHKFQSHQPSWSPGMLGHALSMTRLPVNMQSC